MFLITLLGTGAGVYYLTARNEQHLWQGRQSEAAHYAGQLVGAFLQRTQGNLAMASMLRPQDLSAESGLLEHLLGQDHALLEIVRLDGSGRVIDAAYQDSPILANLFTITQSMWFLEAKAGASYLGDVRISANGEPYLIMAMPTADGGVVAARLSLRVLSEVVQDIQFAQSGRAYVVDREGYILAHTDPEIVLTSTTIQGRPEMTALSQAKDHEWRGTYQDFEGTKVIGVTAPVGGTDWVVITEVSQTEASAVSYTALQLLGLGVLFFGILATVVTARFLERMIFSPLEVLRKGSNRIGGGDLSYRIDLPRTDEVGQVAGAFNHMADELKELYMSLEQQVAERTRELEQRSRHLEAAAEVSRAATSILETDQLMRQAVELIRERFDLYYVGLFLVDESGEWAVLQAGTGEAGQAMLARGHHIKVGEGIIGWSVAHAEARVALDAQAGRDAVRLATAELPDTRSEAALPLKSRGRVIGALSVQHTQAGAFDPDALAVLQTLADQVAVALDNASLFTERQAALEAMRRAYGELSREAWAKQIHARRALGVMSDERGVMPADDAWQPWAETALRRGETTFGQDSTPGLATPVKVRGHVIGVIDAQKPEDAGEWTPEEIAVLETITEQLGAALESARLFEETSAERDRTALLLREIQAHARREALIREITGKVRATTDLETILQTTVTEVSKALGTNHGAIRLGTGDKGGQL
jgi:GAF domain-containing protein/HAMP domain-containing protein